MAKRIAKAPARSSRASPRGAKDHDYTVAGLIALVAIVLLTALFFAQPNVAVGAEFGHATTTANGASTNLGGAAIATAGGGDALAPSSCEAMAYCDGSKLVRQGTDCQQYVGYCTYGCTTDAHGIAICASG